MRTASEQQVEISTISERTVTLKLSTADVGRLAEKAASAGLSISELLENYIGDLVDGTYSNGSDERMYANQYFDRCGFAYMTRKSFLRYLSFNGVLEYTLETWDDYQVYKEIFEDPSEDITTEERNEARENMAWHMDDLNNVFDEYKRWSGPEATSLETEMAEVLSWQADVKRLMTPNLTQQLGSDVLTDSNTQCVDPAAMGPGTEQGRGEWAP